MGGSQTKNSDNQSTQHSQSAQHAKEEDVTEFQ